MDIIDRGDDSGEDLVQIAFAASREEVSLVHGLLREGGIRSLTRSRRIFVRPRDAAAARELLAETMAEEPPEEIPESANARYLDDFAGHRLSFWTRLTRRRNRGALRRSPPPE